MQGTRFTSTTLSVQLKAEQHTIAYIKRAEVLRDMPQNSARNLSCKKDKVRPHPKVGTDVALCNKPLFMEWFVLFIPFKGE